MFVEIGGIPQWLQIEEESAGNPVLLLVHGGPGAPTRFASEAWRGWRRHFTLVHWDQRGAGRTFAENGPASSEPMRFEQIVRDGIEVAAFLRTHLQDRPIILLGHSWGSAIGVTMVRRRPDLFAAFVGTGMLVNFEDNERENYRRALLKATQSNNRAAIVALSEAGPPPYEDIDCIRVLRDWSDTLSDGDGDAPQPSVTPPADRAPEDRQALVKGLIFSAQTLYPELCRIDLPSLGLEFTLPMFCLMGTHDQQTPFTLAERYFETISAPYKAVIPFAGCHHFVHMNCPQAFLDALLNQVMPQLS